MAQFYPAQPIQFDSGTLGRSYGIRQPFSINYVTQSTQSAINDVWTFAGLNIGADVAGVNKRYTVLAIGGGSSAGAGWTSTTLNGNAMSIVSDGVTSAIANDGAGGADALARLYYYDTTGLGTTATVVVDFAGDTYGCTIGVFRLINPTSITAYDVTVDNVHSLGVCTLDVNINTGGKAIGCTMGNNATGGGPTWTGLTRHFASDMSAGDFFSAASGGSAGTPHAIASASPDSSPDNMCGVSASWY